LIALPDDEHADYRGAIIAYYYHVLDRERNELVAYHWHPGGGGRVITPHMHISNRLAPLEIGRGEEPLALSGLHFPTNDVRLRDIVRFLFEELGVQPLRNDWIDLLAGDGPGGPPE
jgi:hypothetical protein